MPETKHSIGDKIEYSETKYMALEKADALLIVTEWADFKSPNFEKIKKTLINPIIFDGRNIYDTKELNEFGFEHYGIGTNNIN
jgi:UDPglucose 6-dehydrogenase